MNSKLLFILIIISWIGCTRSSDSKKIQKERNNIINIKDRVTKIEIEETPLSNFATPYILGDYLVISDYKSPDKLIHIFDKNTFTYITSTGDRGQGPLEIANLGRISVNKINHELYVTDHGKQEIFNFNLDSILLNPFYLPTRKIKLDNMMYPYTYTYINDTLSIGLFMKILDNSDYSPIVARWNMVTGEITPMKFLKHPEIERKRVSLAVSVENNLYVECYWYHDLFTIGYLNGDFKCNIYGAKWNTKTSNIDGYYRDVIFCKDKIVASYLGEKRLIEVNGTVTSVYPTKLIVFDKNGDYIKTLETGHPISYIYYDENKNRIIMALQDDYLLAYLDLNDII